MIAFLTQPLVGSESCGLLTLPGYFLILKKIIAKFREASERALASERNGQLRSLYYHLAQPVRQAGFSARYWLPVQVTALSHCVLKIIAQFGVASRRSLTSERPG